MGVNDRHLHLVVENRHWLYVGPARVPRLWKAALAWVSPSPQVSDDEFEAEQVSGLLVRYVQIPHEFAFFSGASGEEAQMMSIRFESWPGPWQPSRRAGTAVVPQVHPSVLAAKPNPSNQ